MNRRLLLLTSLFIAVTATLTLLPRVWAGAPSSSVRVGTADESGLTLTLTSTDYWLDEDGLLVGEGLNARVQTPGAPALPYYSTLIAVPPGADVAVTVRELGVATAPIDGVQPAPTLSFDARAVTELDSAEHLTLAYTADPAIYDSRTLFPDAVYTLSEPFYYRDVRLVRLSLFPLRYNTAFSTLHHSSALEATLTFERPLGVVAAAPLGGALDLTPLGSLLNPEQARQWRSAPPSLNSTPSNFPTGVPTYKIEVKRPGIYQVTYADLQAAGMDVNAVNPLTFEMMHLGQPVRYAWVGDNDAVFEPGEAVRFYGFPFEGSRYEGQHFNHNVFWLWAGGTPTTVTNVANSAGGTTVTEVDATITADPNYVYHPTWTNDWDTFDNEATAFFWRAMWQYGVVMASYNVTMTIDYPAPAGPDAAYQAEVFGLWEVPHDVTVRVNGDVGSETNKLWNDRVNVNIDGTVAQSTLIDGVNTVTFELANLVAGSVGWDYTFLERITVTYRRLLQTDDNRLRFDRTTGGSHRFLVGGFSEGNAANLLAWDVSDRLNPVAITLAAGDVTGAGPYTVGVGRTHAADAEFYVAATSALHAPVSVSEYVGVDLEPPGGGAKWLAISHGDFIAELQRLAAHRTTISGLTTHVVDVDDVVNQYGYGLRTPHGIRSYIAHAVADWSEAPHYVVLGGDSTVNPRGLPCLVTYGCSASNWPTTAYPYVPTFFQAIDRFQGFVPADHFYATISGNDNLADLAVGRLTASTLAAMTIIVDKIILYETNLQAPQPWMENFLFVSDDFDPSAGDFCYENSTTADAHLPAAFTDIQLCLPSTAPGDVAALRTAMFDQINTLGTIMLSYRGHGGTADWADNLIMKIPDDLVNWTNVTRPLIILSADCLDGYFIGGTAGLAESLLRHNNGGSAAHWSSTGLGFSSEHTIMHQGFYDGLFIEGLTAMGDAILYAKQHYDDLGQDESEMIAFTLQGDPAMQVLMPNLGVEMAASPTDDIVLGDTVAFTMTVDNQGLYPTHFTMTQTVPAEFNITGVTVPPGVTYTIVPGVASGPDAIVFESVDETTWGDTFVIYVSAQMATLPTGPVDSTASITGSGVEADPSNDNASVTLTPDLTPTAVRLVGVSAESTPHTLWLLAAVMAVTLFVWHRQRRRA